MTFKKLYFCHNKTKLSLLFYCTNSSSQSKSNQNKQNGQIFCEKVKLTKIFNRLKKACSNINHKNSDAVANPGSFSLCSCRCWTVCVFLCFVNVTIITRPPGPVVVITIWEKIRINLCTKYVSYRDHSSITSSCFWLF